MKNIILSGLALLCFIGCSIHEIETIEIDQHYSIALSAGGTDSLQMGLNVEWPVTGLPPVGMQNIQRELISAIFGINQVSIEIEEVIKSYVAKQEAEYRQNANDLKIALQDYPGEGVYSWSEMIEGRFMKPVHEMQSYLIYTYGYTGGAHGIDSESGYTFSLSNGKRIVENDLFIQEYKPELARLLTEQLPKAVSKDVYDMLFIKSIEPNNNFYIEPDGITYIYGRYEIGPYASGIVHIRLPWEKMSGILK